MLLADSREPHMKQANPQDQPYMCRNFEKEHGARDFWELPAEMIGEREKHDWSESVSIFETVLKAEACFGLSKTASEAREEFLRKH